MVNEQFGTRPSYGCHWVDFRVFVSDNQQCTIIMMPLWTILVMGIIHLTIWLLQFHLHQWSELLPYHHQDFTSLVSGRQFMFLPIFHFISFYFQKCQKY